MRWMAVFLLFLAACAQKPGLNLASKACLVHKGVTTKEEVRRYLGSPQKIERLPQGREVWIYYDLRRDVWASFPALGSKIGHKEIQVLRITFQGSKAVDCIYYVAQPES